MRAKDSNDERQPMRYERMCDNPVCADSPEHRFLYCAKHLGEEIERWLQNDTPT